MGLVGFWYMDHLLKVPFLGFSIHLDLVFTLLVVGQKNTQRIDVFFHLMDRYSLQYLKKLNNKPIPLSRGAPRVPLPGVLGASRCNPRHQLMSSAVYILLFHCFKWLLRFLPGTGHLCSCLVWKKSLFPALVCINFSFNCNEMQKAWSVVFK